MNSRFFLVCTLFLFTSSLQLSCTNNTEDTTKGPSCSEKESCAKICNELFETKSSADICLNLSETAVSNVQNTLTAIENQQWSTIRPSELRALLNISKEVWLQHIHTNPKQAQDMLLWLAENPDIGKQMEETEEIIKKAFEALTLSQGDQAFVEGLKKVIDTENNKTFLEICAENNNDTLFIVTHNALVQECNNTSCIKNLYCDLDRSIIFGKLNKLGLGTTADQDGDSLHSDEC